MATTSNQRQCTHHEYTGTPSQRSARAAVRPSPRTRACDNHPTYASLRPYVAILHESHRPPFHRARRAGQSAVAAAAHARHRWTLDAPIARRREGQERADTAAHRAMADCSPTHDHAKSFHPSDFPDHCARLLDHRVRPRRDHSASHPLGFLRLEPQELAHGHHR